MQINGWKIDSEFRDSRMKCWKDIFNTWLENAGDQKKRIEDAAVKSEDTTRRMSKVPMPVRLWISWRATALGKMWSITKEKTLWPKSSNNEIGWSNQRHTASSYVYRYMQKYENGLVVKPNFGISPMNVTWRKFNRPSVNRILVWVAVGFTCRV